MTDEQMSIELQAPGGIRGKLTGIDSKVVLLALLIVVCVGAIGWAWYEDRVTDRDSRAMYLAQHKVTQGMLSAVLTSNQAIVSLLEEVKRENKTEIREMTNEMTFVLTRTQAQRESLKLEMPQSLRRKLSER